MTLANDKSKLGRSKLAAARREAIELLYQCSLVLMDADDREELDDMDKRLLARVMTVLNALYPDGFPQCTCGERSWYGSDHDTACPLTGERF